MTVIDASVVLEILSRSDTGLRIRESLIGVELHAPHLIDLEVVQTLRRWAFAGTLHAREAEEALDAFLALKIVRHPHLPLLKNVWSLRHNLTVYDASYLALAQILGAELLTLDGGLQKIATRRVH